MEFELHFTQPIGGVFAIDAADIDGPSVCVVRVEVGWAIGGVEGRGDTAEDCGEKVSAEKGGVAERGAYRKVCR